MVGENILGLEMISQILGISPLLLFLLIIWTFVWTGLGLWKAARKKSVAWFIVLFLVNTIGLLEILYIFVFSELDKKRDKIEKISLPSKKVKKAKKSSKKSSKKKK